MIITSAQNQNVKFVQKLEKSSFRRENQLFIIEGFKEIGLALDADYLLNKVFYCAEIQGKNDVYGLIESLKNTVEILEISKEVFDKIAYRENSDGILALAHQKKLGLLELKLPENPLIMVLESVEKPGNLGAILRSCDAAKVDAVIVCDLQTDVFNPNVVRSSIGCLFTNQIAVASSQETFDFLKKNKIKTYAAALTATEFYHETNLKDSCAILMGTEATGLSDFWLQNADLQIKIPMLGKIDSLNVSTSAAILIFEAKRQRGFEDLSR